MKPEITTLHMTLRKSLKKKARMQAVRDELSLAEWIRKIIKDALK